MSPLPRSRESVTAIFLARAANDMLLVERSDLAEDFATRSLAEDVTCVAAHSVLGVLKENRLDWAGSIAHFETAATLAPTVAQYRLNLGMALLRQGDFARGLPLYEARIDKPDWHGFGTPASRAAERHRLLTPGEPLRGRRILVFNEQGLGDSIMFARYLTLLNRRGAKVVLACAPKLAPVLGKVEGVDETMVPPADLPSPKINISLAQCDAWAPIMSLASILGTTAATVPAEVPFLRIEPQMVAAARSHYAQAGRAGARKVGLVIQANPDSPNAVDRSWPIPLLDPLMEVPGVDWVNLQFGPAGRALQQAAPAMIDMTQTELPLDAFAAAIAATDLLVTIDTMALHLSGGQAHPTWVAVPHCPSWMWGTQGETVAWYPTVRVFRQKTHRDWTPTITAIAQTLDQQRRVGFSPSL